MFRTILFALALAGISVPACERKDDRTRGAHTAGGPSGSGKAGMDPARPARRRPAPWLSDLRYGATSERRYEALDRFVKAWPADREALPDVLAVMVKDEAMRGGIALSLSRIGAPLVPALVDLVRRAPRDEPTLLAAGVLSYSLVSPQGLQPLPEAKRLELRSALAPVREALWAAFLADTRPNYEIYQGLAAGGLETAKLLGQPVPEGGLSRVAMVLYLLLTRLPNEVLLPEAERRQIRRILAPLAAPMARALGSAKPGLTGESPESLLLGLSVLGSAGAASLASEPSMRAPERCEAVAKVLVSLDEQAGPRAAAPARELLARCMGNLTDSRLAERAKDLLPRLDLTK